MNIPREQGELLNRLTKSDDSLNAQFLMSHSRLAVEQQETVAESSESLQSLNVPAQAASHALPKNSDYGERDKMSEQAIPVLIRMICLMVANLLKAILKPLPQKMTTRDTS